MKNEMWRWMLPMAMLVLAAGCGDSDSKDKEEYETEDIMVDTESDTDDTDGTDSRNDTDSNDDEVCAGITDLSVDILEREIELEGEIITKKVNTVLVVNWEQTKAADEVKLRFTFENDEWFESPVEPGKKGPHEIPVLGVPELTDVTIHIVSETDGEETICETGGTTLAIPKSVPRATLQEYDASLASDNRWMLGTVEKTPNMLGMYEGVATLYIIDRQGRIVWYYLDQAWRPVTAYPRIARDGTHVYFERSTYLDWDSEIQPSIARTTLDFSQFEQIAAPSMTDSMDITDDGSYIYNTEEWLIELLPNGEERKVWDCRAWLAEVDAQSLWLENKFDLLKSIGKLEKISKMKKVLKVKPEKLENWTDEICYSNSVVWNPAEDSVLLSFPHINTVVEISRETGELIGQWGEASGSWKFEPEDLGFVFQHGANITQDGTLLISTREMGIDNPYLKPEHYFIELELDRKNQVATEIWRFGEGYTDWPAVKGEVFPVEGGNRLGNYGSAGVIREITPDNEVAWEIKWDAELEVPAKLAEVYDSAFSEDDINNMVGHNILINDLYELNTGWESK